MSTMFEARLSDSPHISMIWQGRTGENYAPICPADSRWHILLIKYKDRIKVSLEGPMTRATSRVQPEGLEFFGIKFKLGIFMPYLPVKHLLDIEKILPQAAGQSFWLDGAAWQLPTYDNAETFVSRLVHNEVLVWDSVVSAVLQDEPQDMSYRTVRRRFLLSTGLTHKAIQQIERAQQAASLLEQGMSILDVVYQVGYADQPHMTRSLKHFIGYTPAQIARVNQSQGDGHFIQDREPLLEI
jgi:hypothetical protein